jgi:hypothetical protein
MSSSGFTAKEPPEDVEGTADSVGSSSLQAIAPRRAGDTTKNRNAGIFGA